MSLGFAQSSESLALLRRDGQGGLGMPLYRGSVRAVGGRWASALVGSISRERASVEYPYEALDQKANIARLLHTAHHVRGVGLYYG